MRYGLLMRYSLVWGSVAESPVINVRRWMLYQEIILCFVNPQALTHPPVSHPAFVPQSTNTVRTFLIRAQLEPQHHPRPNGAHTASGSYAKHLTS
jgi:hypothetical protein